MAVTNYYTVNGEIIGEKTAGSTRVDYLTDALGSVTATVNSSAQVVNTYRYKPFGKQLAKTGTGADPAFSWVGSQGYRPTQRKFSDFYVRARHPDTSTGRWTTKDPIGLEGGDLNPYRVVLNRPAVLTDPYGLTPVPGWAARYVSRLASLDTGTDTSQQIIALNGRLLLGSGQTHPNALTSSGEHWWCCNRLIKTCCGSEDPIKKCHKDWAALVKKMQGIFDGPHGDTYFCDNACPVIKDWLGGLSQLCGTDLMITVTAGFCTVILWYEKMCPFDKKTNETLEPYANGCSSKVGIPMPPKSPPPEWGD